MDKTTYFMILLCALQDCDEHFSQTKQGSNQQKITASLWRTLNIEQEEDLLDRRLRDEQRMRMKRYEQRLM